MTSITSPVLPGETIADKYLVERLLGQGGMGVVVAARHLELEQTVAIKFLCGNPPPNARERFMREARAAALVKSEHVCRVFDVGKLDSGEPYIVMEYLEGTDLAEKITSEGPQPIKDAVSWIIQACDALSSAHAKDIVHRDLKPANLFLQSNPDNPPAIKVVDFGISKLPTSGQLTESIVVMGSPLYMSPEQLASTRDADSRSDIWSLGVVLYELLTGVPPFMGNSLVQLAVALRELDPKPPRSLRPDIPAEVEAAILTCLSKNPDDRFATVAELVEALRPFAHDDVAALAGKLVRRGRRVSEPEIDALGKTVSRDGPGDTAAGPTSAPTSERLGGKTLDAVQTVSAKEGRARWAFAAGLATVAVLAGIVRLSLPRRGANPPMPLVSSESVLPASAPAASPLPPPELPPLTNAPPSSSATSTASSVAAPASTPQTASTQAPVRDNSRKPNPNPIASSKPVASAAPPTASAPPTQPPASSTPSGPKKRELDRDYKNE